jgi:hypothetical protein
MTAETIERESGVTKRELTVYREKIAGIVRKSDAAPYIVPVPGLGTSLAAAFIAYAGDGERFSKVCPAPADVRFGKLT